MGCIIWTVAKAVLASADFILSLAELEKETFAARIHQSGYVTFYAGKYLNECGTNQVMGQVTQSCRTAILLMMKILN